MKTLCSSSLYLFGGGPALERRPDAALEPEAVDRRRRPDGRDAIQPDPGPLEATLLQHSARRPIGDPRAGVQRRIIESAERIVDHRVSGLRGVAFAPMR